MSRAHDILYGCKRQYCTIKLDLQRCSMDKDCNFPKEIQSHFHLASPTPRPIPKLGPQPVVDPLFEPILTRFDLILIPNRPRVVTLLSSHRLPHLSGQTPLLRVEFGVGFWSFLLVFRPFSANLVKNGQNRLEIGSS